MLDMPVFRLPILAAIPAHRRNHDAVVEDDATQSKRFKKPGCHMVGMSLLTLPSSSVSLDALIMLPRCFRVASHFCSKAIGLV